MYMDIEKPKKHKSQPTIQRKGSLPGQVIDGISKLTNGKHDLSNVDVKKDATMTAQLNAHAFTQGNSIHIAPGQEKHIAHEAWHVVQQREGRVKPTTQVAGQPVNDNPALEKEADEMGSRAMRVK